MLDKGKIAQARRLLEGTDNLILLVSDDNYLKDVPYKQMEVVENNLRQAHLAITNILYTLGDMGSYPLPTQTRSKLHEHWM